jgi:hypothetical protein
MTNVKAIVIIKDGRIEMSMETDADIARLRETYADCEVVEIARSIPLPHTGDRTDFFNADWTRKTDVELVLAGLKPMPFGKKLAGDAFVDMSSDEKVIAGISPLPSGMKIAGDKVVPMSLDERHDAGLVSDADYLVAKTSEADAELNRRLAPYLAAEAIAQAEIDGDYAAERKTALAALLAVKKQAGWPLNVLWTEI